MVLQVEREQKRLEQLEKKQEAKRLLEEEEASVRSKQSVAKVTRAQITASQAEVAPSGAVTLPKGVVVTAELRENPNLVFLQRQADGHVDARTIDEAISVLSVSGPAIDRHPEKRLKAAYTAFEERELPRLKADNPNLRLSQIKQLLRKEWMKSAENPMNYKT